MYRRLLAAVNEHLASEIAARYCLELARVTGGKVYLAYIAEKGISGKDLDLAQKAIRRLFLQAKEMNISVEAIFETGEPFRRIKEIREEKGINIIFGATRKEQRDSRYVLGSFAKRLLSLNSSVALVRIVHLGRLHPRRILIPLKDRIDHIDERAYFCSMMSRAFQSELRLLHIKRPIRRLLHGEIHLTSVEIERDLSKDILSFMEQIKRYGQLSEKRLFHGSPEKDITIEALSGRTDLIIMGSSARGFIQRILERSPVEYVLEKTPCNLIIHKPSI